MNDYTIIFIVIDPANAKKWADNNGGFNVEQLINNKVFKYVVFADLMDLAAKNKFNSLEKPKNITLILDPWTVENGMLTPT